MYRDFLNQNSIQRYRILENRDLLKGLRCNRNERVEYWDEEFIKELSSGISAIDHTVYPDLTNLYAAISEHESIPQENLLVGSGIDGIIKITECTLEESAEDASSIILKSLRNRLV